MTAPTTLPRPAEDADRGGDTEVLLLRLALVVATIAPLLALAPLSLPASIQVATTFLALGCAALGVARPSRSYPTVLLFATMLLFVIASVSPGGRTLWTAGLLWGASALAVLVLTARLGFARLRMAVPTGGAPVRAPRIWPVLAIGVALLPLALLLAQVAPSSIPPVVDERSHLGSGGADGTGYGDLVDTNARFKPSKQVVMRVRSTDGALWRSGTYDSFDGQRWSQSAGQGHRQPLPNVRGEAAIYSNPGEDDELYEGTLLRQRFHLTSRMDSILGATNALSVSLPAGVGAVWHDDRSVSTRVMGSGTTYTVTSRRPSTDATTLRAAVAAPIPVEVSDRYAAPPKTTDRVRQLALRITAAAPTTYDKVKAIDGYLRATTSYDLDAPSVGPGVDAVDAFLFETHRGFCQHYASATVVMLRAIGIPARFVVGYSPGDYDAASGEWVVRGANAHAWTEVYIAGIGWREFDTTGVGPGAGDPPSSPSKLALLRQLLELLGRIPIWLIAVVGAALIAWFGRGPIAQLLARSRRPWPEATARRIERLGKRRKVPRSPGQTLREYASVLAPAVPDRPVVEAAAAVEQEVYAERPLPEDERRRLTAALKG